MNTPPPFSSHGAPPKRSNTTLWIVIIVAVCVLVPCGGLIALGFFGMSWFGKTVQPMATCAILFQGVRQSLEDYADDHEGKLPEASKWQDEVQPYYAKWRDRQSKDMGPFAPPAASGDWGCVIEGQKTGMAFNSDLSGMKWSEIKDPGSTVLIFEIESVLRNANSPYKERSKSSSPKMMGKPRGWIKVRVEGSSDGMEFGD